MKILPLWRFALFLALFCTIASSRVLYLILRSSLGVFAGQVDLIIKMEINQIAMIALIASFNVVLHRSSLKIPRRKILDTVFFNSWSDFSMLLRAYPVFNQSTIKVELLVELWSILFRFLYQKENPLFQISFIYRQCITSVWLSLWFSGH